MWLCYYLLLFVYLSFCLFVCLLATLLTDVNAFWWNFQDSSTNDTGTTAGVIQINTNKEMYTCSLKYIIMHSWLIGCHIGVMSCLGRGLWSLSAILDGETSTCTYLFNVSLRHTHISSLTCHNLFVNAGVDRSNTNWNHTDTPIWLPWTWTRKVANDSACERLKAKKTPKNQYKDIVI